MVSALLALILVLAGTPLALAAALDVYGVRCAPRNSYDAIVVAGCRVRADGRPSAALLRRAVRGAELFLDGRAPVLVLTGGSEAGRRPEAEVAFEVCAALGVPESAMRMEDASRDTRENAAFSAALVQGRVLVVTDAFHVWRCRRLFARHFVAVDASATAPRGWVRLRYALREVFAIAHHLWMGNL